MRLIDADSLIPNEECDKKRCIDCEWNYIVGCEDVQRLVNLAQTIEPGPQWIEIIKFLDPESDYVFYDDEHGFCINIQDVLDRLRVMSSAQPEPRWTPCSEGLPKDEYEDEYVLISKKPTKLSGYKWSVTIAIRMADPRSGKIQWRDIGFGVIQDDEVLAWMPRPEPYKEVKE